MTTRRPRGVVLDRRHREALTSFVRGYLHQDVLDAHGTPAGAATAFARASSETERQRVIAALDLVSQAAARGDVPDLAAFFVDKLRSSWMPAGPRDVRALADAMRRTFPAGA